MPGPAVCHIVRLAVWNTTGRGRPRPYGVFMGNLHHEKAQHRQLVFPHNGAYRGLGHAQRTVSHRLPACGDSRCGDIVGVCGCP